MVGTAQERLCPPYGHGLTSPCGHALADADDFSNRDADSLTKDRVSRPGGVFRMNSFDAVVYLGLIIAVVIGFNTGLLRSAIAILAYIAAMPIAMGLVPLVSPQLDGQHALPFAQNSPLFFGVFLVTGMVLGKLACVVLDDVIGPQAGIGPPCRRRPWRGARRPDCDHR